jgi:hypothetical protein
VIVNGAALAILPAKNEQMIPGTGPDKVAHVRAVGEANKLGDLIAVDAKLGKQPLQNGKFDAFFKSIERGDEVIQGFGHGRLPSSEARPVKEPL